MVELYQPLRMHLGTQRSAPCACHECRPRQVRGKHLQGDCLGGHVLLATTSAQSCQGGGGDRAVHAGSVGANLQAERHGTVAACESHGIRALLLVCVARMPGALPGLGRVIAGCEANALWVVHLGARWCECGRMAEGCDSERHLGALRVAQQQGSAVIAPKADRLCNAALGKRRTRHTSGLGRPPPSHPHREPQPVGSPRPTRTARIAAAQ